MKITEAIPQYMGYLRMINYSAYTIKSRKNNLHDFARYLEDIGIMDTNGLNPEALESYQADLSFRLTKKGTPLAIETQMQRLIAVRGFTKFMEEKNQLLSDPGTKLRLPKRPERLPH